MIEVELVFENDMGSPGRVFKPDQSILGERDRIGFAVIVDIGHSDRVTDLADVVVEDDVLELGNLCGRQDGRKLHEEQCSQDAENQFNFYSHDERLSCVLFVGQFVILKEKIHFYFEPRALARRGRGNINQLPLPACASGSSLSTYEYNSSPNRFLIQKERHQVGSRCETDRRRGG